MKDENDQRRRSIAPAIVASGVTATIYDTGRRRYRNERERRAACLRAVVGDAARRGDAMLILEQDDTLIATERKLLYRAARDANCPDLRYEHRRAAAEQLLALPDAIAWCWAKGGGSDPSSSTSVRSDLAQTSAKPERHGRPAGSRAHFHTATAVGNTQCMRSPRPLSRQALPGCFPDGRCCSARCSPPAASRAALQGATLGH